MTAHITPESAVAEQGAPSNPAATSVAPTRGGRRATSRRVRRNRTVFASIAGLVIVALVIVAFVVFGRGGADVPGATAAWQAQQPALSAAADAGASARADAEAAIALADPLLALQGEPVTAEATAALAAAREQAAATLAALPATPNLDPASGAGDDAARATALRAAAEAAPAQAEALTSGAAAASAAASSLTAAVTAFGQAAADRAAALADTPGADKLALTALAQAASALPAATPAELPQLVERATLHGGEVVASSDAGRAETRAAAAPAAFGAPGAASDPVQAQLDYLMHYSYVFNDATWGNWNPLGGDCANFVSQGLIARGWKMDATWNWQAKGKASAAWVYVPAMDAYLASKGLAKHGLDQLDQVKVGDVGIFDWGENGPGQDHTMTVSRIDQTPDGPRLYFVSHNADGQYRELNDVLYTQHSDSTAWFYAIP